LNQLPRDSGIPLRVSQQALWYKLKDSNVQQISISFGGVD
jgi:hypothetical protein